MTETPTPALTYHLLEPLTAAEERVLLLLAQGMSDKEIGLELSLAPITIRGNYKQNIYDKLGLPTGYRNRKWAVHCARQVGLLPAIGDEPDHAPPGDNPYKGLDAFHQDDAHLFFGREAFVSQLIDRLCEDGNMPRFLAVVGPSGSGKSSVVRAGLIPCLQQDKVPGAARWAITTMFPRVNPMYELELALRAVTIKDQAGILDLLQRDAYGLARTTRLILPEDQALLLVIDQFEEIFTLVQDSAQARFFMDLIYAAVTDPRSTVRVIITLRADFLDRPLMYPDFSWLVQNHTAMVVPLTPDELERAITLPAKQAHVTIKPGLVARLVADANEQPGALPLLEFALTELYDNRVGRTITMSAYEEIGGLQQALAAQADRTYSELDDAQREAARQLLLRLITLGEGTEDVRRRVPTQELASLEVQTETLKYVTHFMAANRLLTLDIDPATKEPTAEVAHEALIREWGRLCAWLDESRNDIRMERLLATAAEEWHRHDREESYLMRGAKLGQFEGWRETTDLALTLDENRFLEASIAERDRQRRLRRVIRNLALATAVLVALVMTVLALWANSQRQEAEDQRDKARREANINRSLVLATNAEKQMEAGQPDLALLLALEATAIDQPPNEALRVLSSVALGPGTRAVLEGHRSAVRTVAFSSDSRFGLSGSCMALEDGICTQGETILWDLETATEIRRLEGHTDWVNAVAFNPMSGAPSLTAISASDDGTLIQWDVEIGTITRRFEGHAGAVNSLDISPDGRFVLSGGEDGLVLLWDVDSGAIVQRFEGHVAAVRAVTFSPSGLTVLSGSDDTTIVLWDVETGELIRLFQGASSGIEALAFMPDGSTFFAGDAGLAMHVWDVETGVQIRNFNWPAEVTYLAISPDGQTALIDSGQAVTIWDTRNMRQTNRLTLARVSPRPLLSGAISPNGHSALNGGENGKVYLWNLGETGEIRRLAPEDAYLFTFDLSQDGKHLLTGTWGSGIAILWDYERGHEIWRMAVPDGSAYPVAFSPDGRRALIGSVGIVEDSTQTSLLVVDTETGQPVRVMEDLGCYIRSLAVSPDGRQALSGGQCYGGEWTEEGGDLFLWDIQTGTRLRKFDTPYAITGITFSRDGQQVLTASADGFDVVLWDMQTGSVVRTFDTHGQSSFDVVFGPDETTVLAAIGGATPGVTQWDIGTGEVIRQYASGQTEVWSVAISPDGRYMASGGESGLIVLWDLETGQATRHYTGHRSIAFTLRFTADSRTLISSSYDGTVRKWQVADWTLVELQSWIQSNRYLREFTCDERETYRIEPLCNDAVSSPD